MARPLAFDADEALDAALDVFRAKGYEAASVGDLTSAMGINRPSLYNTFGNKEDLFRQALERYLQGPGSYLTTSLGQPTAADVVSAMLHGAVEVMATDQSPSGCLLVHGALVTSDAAAPIRLELAAIRSGSCDQLRQRLDRAVADGDLEAGSDTRRIAMYVTTMLAGISVEASAGATAEELHTVADDALLVLRDSEIIRNLAARV